MTNANDNVERRVLDLGKIEVRAEGEAAKIGGKAIVFDTLSEDMGGWREVIKPGALDGLRLDTADVFLLRDHDMDRVLARTTANSLKLSISPQSLDFEAQLDTETTLGNDTYRDVMGRRVRGVSFGFVVAAATWSELEDGTPLRTVESIEEIVELSVVSTPAYNQTSVEARNILQEYKAEERNALMLRHQYEEDLAIEEMELSLLEDDER